MMKKTLLLTLVLLLGTAAMAQGPGYLGKHFIINAECRLSPSFINPNSLSEALATRFPDNEHAQRYLGLNYFVNPSLEMIITKKSSVGLGYNFYKSPFKGRVCRDYELVINDYDYHYYSWDFRFTGNMTAHGFSAFYKLYLGDTYAPLDYYMKLTLDGFFYHFNLDQNIPTSLAAHYPEVLKDHGALFGARLEVGRDYLFFNCLRFSMGLSMGATFGGFKTTSVFEEFPDYDVCSKVTPDSYARNRLLSAYWFGLKVGIGVLAF